VPEVTAVSPVLPSLVQDASGSIKAAVKSAVNMRFIS